MNNIDNDILNNLVPRIFKLINNLPENMDINVFNNIFEENEKLKKYNKKIIEQFKNIQNRKNINEHKFINVYYNLKKKIDILQKENYDLQKENYDLQSREYMLISEYENIDKSKNDMQIIINNKNNEIDELHNKLIFKRNEESLTTNLLINKTKNELEILQRKYDELIKINNIENIKLENEIIEKNKEIEILKSQIHSHNNIDVIEKLNSEFKTLLDKYNIEHNHYEQLKLENIELQVEINRLIKNDDTTSGYETEYTTSDEEHNNKKDTRQLFGLKNRKFRQPTQDFFDNLLIEQQNNNYDNKVIIKKPTNFTFSTDYHVDMLQNSNKLVPKEQRTYFKDKQHNTENNINKDIFVKNKETEPTKTINNKLEIIINDKSIDTTQLLQNIGHQTEHKNNITKGGGKNKDRFTIHDIEGTLKMYINNGFSTITDQYIDKNDIDLGRKIYNRKNVRRCRNKK
jgi:hypothetical protein